MHVYDTGIDHPMVVNCAWLPSRPAEQVNDHIWLSRSNSYPYLIANPAGDVVINTGVSHQGPRHRERFEQAIGRPLNVHTLIITQSHPDHYGGWSAFNAAETETIVADNYESMMEERRRLGPLFNGRRTAGMFKRKTIPGEPVTVAFNDEIGKPGMGGGPPITPTKRVSMPYRFEAGGRTFEVRKAPGGESVDGLLVWLPEEATVFCGNLMGANYGAEPHLSTIRGDRPRSARLFIACVEEMLALEPELLCTGHNDPVRGRQRIKDETGKVVDAVRYIYDYTLDGIGAGKSLEQLMAEIKLPKKLEPRDGRGPTMWNVRAVWEEYVGWYRAESVADLYPVPQSAIWPDIIEMAGGAKAVIARASALLAAGRNVEALRFTDMLLAQNPADADALNIEIQALEKLSAADASKHFDLSRLLEMEIERAKNSYGT
jgi:alkyl sulfatase BDS1-like metallo-beta-lactamase superfamily hydrolase